MNDTALGAAIGEAGGKTLNALAHTLGDTGIRVDRIAKLAGHEPGRAYAQRGGLQLPFAALGRTAVALAAIHTTVAANAGATVLIDDLEAGSDAAAKALWTAIAETTRAHGTQVIAATGDRRILRAAADGDGDVAAYSRLDKTSADNPNNTVAPRITLQALSLWLDKHIRADASLDAATRGEPATANLLHNILMDEGPTQVDGEAARRFAALVERFADTEDTQIATVARDVAGGFRKLADEHDELSLQLV